MHMLLVRSDEFMFNTCFFFVLVMSISLSGCFCNGTDTISTGQSLLPDQSIVSKGGKFELGISRAGTSKNYYLGFRFKRDGMHVWIGNRNKPIPGISSNNSLLEMSNGNLYITVNSESIWMLLDGSSDATETVILDTGNFVLRNASGIVWQSFENPSFAWLPGRMIGFRSSSHIEAKLISWRAEDDPGTSDYSFGMETNGSSELVIKNGSAIIWRSGVWQGGSFASLRSDLYDFSYVSRDDTAYLTYKVYDESMIVRIVLTGAGLLMHYLWSDARRNWIALTMQPYNSSFCQTSARCGPNAICDISHSPACRCLNGFVPQVQQDWDSFNFSNGCTRVRSLDCDKDRIFAKENNTKLPARPVRPGRNGSGCEFGCSENCSCNAYAIDGRGGCLLFTGDLLDLERLPNNSAGKDLYVRTESEENPAKGKRKILIVALVVPVTAAILITCFYFCYLRRKLRSKESWEAHQNLLLLDLNLKEHEDNQYEMPIFSFSSIAASTNNFSLENKLGEGGFGPVYKEMLVGELMNGQFVAVKRLAKNSGQGVEEFRNEAELIAKLQHTNLVGILGCCFENDEKILVYEYMPNKSLDSFLFEPAKKELLDWKRRIHIIEGIAQGLLYLHHYSRLRIVHRDLKASNILLDAEMNPKISDFGMARIFGRTDSLPNTQRIVGTYGYMPPEYAREGRFSVNSDGFAFGVLMLEIISGKRNTDFDGSDCLGLLDYAWNMWKHDSALHLIDPILEIPASSSFLPLRYIQIGLLCVEENPDDRPLMSNVVTMLNSEETTIASPQHPAFTVGGTLTKPNPTHRGVETYSANDLTMSQIEAR